MARSSQAEVPAYTWQYSSLNSSDPSPAKGGTILNFKHFEYKFTHPNKNTELAIMVVR